MSNEWYTPARYIEADREVMGCIDLDPASSELANLTVQASRYYTQQEDGLLLPWHGNVWLNPPYTQVQKGHSSIKAWVERTVTFYEQGIIHQAIVLIPNDTSTRWFASLWRYLACFPPRRIKFEIPGKKLKQPTFGTCFAYLGSHEQRFIEVFGKFGPVVRTVSEARITALNAELWTSGSEAV